jgi:Flp pilus assembly protein TadG
MTMRLIPRTLRVALIDRSANAMIQFAMILPAFLLLLFGTFEFGRLLWLQNAMHFAVEQAARCAVVNSTLCGSNSTTASYAASVSGANIPSSAFTLDTTKTTCTYGYIVTGDYTIALMIPYFRVSHRMMAQSCFPN